MFLPRSVTGGILPLLLLQCSPHQTATFGLLWRSAKPDQLMSNRVTTNDWNNKGLQTCRVRRAAVKTSVESEAATWRVEKGFKGRNTTGCETWIRGERRCRVGLHFHRVCLEDFILNAMTQWRAGLKGVTAASTPPFICWISAVCLKTAL